MKSLLPATVAAQLLLSLSVVPGLLAGTIAVEWGGDSVSATQPLAGINGDTITGLDLDNDTFADDSITGRSFSTSVPWSPVSGYSGVPFYGGGAVGMLDGTSDGWEEVEVQNHGPTDDIHFHVHNNTHAHDFHAVIYWDKADFLNGLSTTTGLTLDGTSILSLTISPDTGGHSTSGMDTAQGRWLVRDGGNFWLSEETFFPALTGSGDTGLRTLSGFSDLSDGNWTGYTPSGLDLHFDPGAAVFSDQNFTDVTAVGFMIDNDSFGDNPYDWHLEAFGAEIVPEPSVGLLALLGFGGLLLRRTRR